MYVNDFSRKFVKERVITIEFMTCFWNGILAALKEPEISLLGMKKKDVKQLVIKLKNKNKMITSVKWNGEIITKKLQQENFEWIKDYNTNGIGSGHDCSFCDPFLLLISELFVINIEHHFINNKAVFEHPEAKEIIYFRSSKSHFKYVKRSGI